jgi:hypothetical protein
MRRLVWLVVIFALAWGAWWLFAARTLETGFEQWFEDRRAEGWQAEVAEVRSAGFPTRLRLTLDAPALADPETGVAVTAPELVFEAPVWWPGHLTVTFPQDDIVVATPVARQTISAQDSVAEMRLKPGTNLEVEQMTLVSGPWDITSPVGDIASGEGMTLALQQSETEPLSYDIRADVPAFQPGEVPRKAMLIPADWPVAFDSLTLAATVDFDRVLDRSTIDVARPQPRRIDLTLAEAIWGQLSLRATALLDIDADGIPTGEVSLQARNWREILAFAEAAGSIPKAFVPQLETVLRALARSGGNPDAIDVGLELRNGNIYLGFIPLGSAPRIILR